MTKILKLTERKSAMPVRVNFDNVAFYRTKGEHTEIVFISPRFYEHTLNVKETVEHIDRLLGIE